MKLIKFLFLFLLLFSTILPQVSLDEEIKSVIKAVDPHAHVGIMLYCLNDQKILYQYQAKKLFVPASNTKIVTALIALHHLGPDFYFKTKIFQDKGNLYIKGDGDPSLMSPDLELLAKKLWDKGITKITGNIYVDATVFDKGSYGPGRMLDDGDCCAHGLNIDHNHKPNPPIYAGKILRQKLINHKIFVHGTVHLGKTPLSAKLVATHKSLPLTELIVPLMKISHNLYGECLFKKSAHGALKTQGTFATATTTAHDFLVSHLNFNSHNFVIGDGAGFSRYNLLSPEQIIKMLSWVHRSPHGKSFTQALAISGVDGSLEERLLDMPGKIKAKTGRMTGVACLSGYFNDAKGNPCAFSIMVNSLTDSKRISRRLGIKASGAHTQEPCEYLDDQLCRVLVRHMSSQS